MGRKNRKLNWHLRIKLKEIQRKIMGLKIGIRERMNEM